MAQFGATDDESVVFAADSTEEFETQDETDDSYAGAGEHSAGGDVP